MSHQPTRWIPEQPPDQICEHDPQAPFCAGPSMRECPGAGEVPENTACPGNDTGALGATPGSCEEDGSCDDSCTPPARGDCHQTEIGTAHVTTPPHQIELAELPATGVGVDMLLLVGAAAVAAGFDLVYRRRRTR